MYLFVGSTNPVKVNGTQQACQHFWPDATVKGFSTESGVSEQPRSDEETREGAQNRAVSAFEQGKNWLLEQENAPENMLGVGLEGGVFQKDDELWSTVWAVVTDGTPGIFWEVNGARFKVPEPIATKIQNGEEMGPIVGKLMSDPNLKEKQGMIGVITNGFVERTEEYSSLAKLALGLWHGRNWYER